MGIDFSPILNFLNKYVNLILVIITAIYAFLTYKMVSLMKQQIVANIHVSKAVVKSGFLARKNRNSKDILLKEIVDKNISSFKDELVTFRLSIDIYNSSSGSGSIDQPKLLLCFKKKKACVELKNINEQSGSRETIFMQGGDLEKKDFEYFLAFNESFFKSLQKYPGKLEYYVKYKDNLNKKYLVKIDKVEPLL